MKKLRGDETIVGFVTLKERAWRIKWMFGDNNDKIKEELRELKIIASDGDSTFEIGLW